MTDNITVALSANAGVSLTLGGRRVWIDVLHDEKTQDYSTVAPELAAAVKTDPNFAEPDLICFTHCHRDHFSAGMTKEFLSIWPRAKVALPEDRIERQVVIDNDGQMLWTGGVSLRFHRLTHAGKGLGHTPHYGVLAEYRGRRILLAGDSLVANPEIDAMLQDGPIDTAILNFPWITLWAGKRYLLEKMKPKHLLICHLPFKEDDHCGYRAAAEKAAGSLREQGVDVRLLERPLQVEIID